MQSGRIHSKINPKITKIKGQFLNYVITIFLKVDHYFYFIDSSQNKIFNKNNKRGLLTINDNTYTFDIENYHS